MRFIVVDLSPRDFVDHLWRSREALSLANRERLVLAIVQLAHEIAVFRQRSSVRDLRQLPRQHQLPIAMSDDLERLAACRLLEDFDESVQGLQRDSETDWTQPSVWAELLLTSFWWTTCIQEGPDVQGLLAPAFYLHRYVDVRDPYFCSMHRRDKAGTQWFLETCFARGVRSVHVHCRAGSRDDPRGEWWRRLRGTLTTALGRSGHAIDRRYGFHLRLSVYENSATFHDRSLIFYTERTKGASSAYFLGTGLSAFGRRRRKILVGRTRKGHAADIVSGNAAGDLKATVRWALGQLEVKWESNVEGLPHRDSQVVRPST